MPTLYHARLHLACTTELFITRDLPRATIRGGLGNDYYLTYKQSSVMGAAQARGLGRAWAVARGGGAQRAGAAIASEFPRAWEAERERAASTHAMQCQNGNGACECQIAKKGAHTRIDLRMTGARDDSL